MTKFLHAVNVAFSKIGTSRPITIVVSVGLAILLWFYISVTIYPTTPITFYDIPVTVEIDNSVSGANDLSVISCDVESVTVQIVGNRSEVGILTADDLVAYAITDTVSSSGDYTLRLTVRTEDASVDFDINYITPSTAKVSFDYIETREFTVTPSFPNITLATGLTLDSDSVSCDPTTISITGPSAQLNQIASVSVVAEKKVEIDSSYTLYASEVLLYTESGSLLDSEDLEIASEDFKIDIPVLTQNELTLSYTIRNAGGNFDTEWLMGLLEMSEESITLASTNTSLATREVLTLGSINLEDIGLDFNTTLTVPLEDEDINQSGFDTVSITLNSEGLSTREFTINGDSISIINAPSGYDFSIITKQLTVTVIGPEDDVNALSTSDIYVTLDLTNALLSSESFTESCTVSVDHSRVWANGAYKVALSYTEKELETTEETTD